MVKILFLKKGLLIFHQQPFTSLLYQRSDSQALATLSTAASNDLAAVLGSHAVQETVDAAALTLLGLESTLHFSFLLLKFPVWGDSGFCPTLGQPCRLRLYAMYIGFVNTFYNIFSQKRRES